MSIERYLVVKGSGGAGLGDKVRAVISAIVYAKLSGRKLYVDWNDPAYGDGVNNYFSHLFRLEGVETTNERPLCGTVRPAAWQGNLHLNQNQLYAKHGAPPWNRVWSQKTFSFDQGVLDWPEDVCVMWDFDQFKKLIPHLPRLYPPIPTGWSAERLQGYVLKQHMHPSTKIEVMMQPYLQRLQTMGPYVGVHVRAAEDNFRMRNAPPVSDYVKAVRKMMRRKKASGVFLATDNRDVQDLFMREFGRDRVVWTGKWLPEPGVALQLGNDCPDRLQSARDALTDILLLASAGFLVTMGNSSFSMLARMFSTAPLDHRVTLMYRAPLLNRILRRIRVAGKAFLTHLLKSKLRAKLGCWVHERWKAELAMLPTFPLWPNIDWVDLCNRHEKLHSGSAGFARECQWTDSSWLTIARVFPRVGGRLLAHCLQQWPMRFCSVPPIEGKSTNPEISVVVPFFGEDRMPQLRTVLASFWGQTGVEFEVIVVEEGEKRILPADIVSNIRYIYLHKDAHESYCKSRMVNAGVEASRGRHFVLHDADVAIPAQYLAEIVSCLESGWEAVRPIRLLFYLDEQLSQVVKKSNSVSMIKHVPDVLQNFPGASLAMNTEIFWKIGGMCESFKEWGWQDVEFLDRLTTRNVFAGAWLPAVHLWHAPAKLKASKDYRNKELLLEKRSMSMERRIEELVRQRRRDG